MTMRTRRKHIAPLLAAVAVVAAIGSAPVGAADEPVAPDPAVSAKPILRATGRREYKCESPGNARLNDAPPVTNFFPQGDD